MKEKLLTYGQTEPSQVQGSGGELLGEVGRVRGLQGWALSFIDLGFLIKIYLFTVENTEKYKVKKLEVILYSKSSSLFFSIYVF